MKKFDETYAYHCQDKEFYKKIEHFRKLNKLTKNALIDLALHNFFEAPSTETMKEPLSEPKKNVNIEPFNYETFECECPEGTYIKEKKKVYCRARIKSIVKWLPSNRLVLPQVCQECFTVDRFGTYRGFQNWLEKQPPRDQIETRGWKDKPETTRSMRRVNF